MIGQRVDWRFMDDASSGCQEIALTNGHPHNERDPGDNRLLLGTNYTKKRHMNFSSLADLHMDSPTLQRGVRLRWESSMD